MVTLNDMLHSQTNSGAAREDLPTEPLRDFGLRFWDFSLEHMRYVAVILTEAANLVYSVMNLQDHLRIMSSA